MSSNNHTPPSYNPRRSPIYSVPPANGTDNPMAGNNAKKRPFYSSFDGTSSDHEMVEDDGECILLQPGEKRGRRLTVEQVRALEKAFDVDNKLDPVRKVQLANQLALQERQVAVWFQNRRARWKTKQMERDFFSLKKKMELLKSDRDKLIKDKELLEAEVLRLKCELTNKDKVVKLELEVPVQQERSISPNVSAHVREVEQSACTQQKEKDGSCFNAGADDTSCDAASVVDNLDSPVSRSTHEDHQSSFSLVYYPGSEAAIIQTETETETETLGLLNDANILPDFYDARIISCGLRAGIKAEDVFSEEVESTTGFVPFDWWEAN